MAGYQDLCEFEPGVIVGAIEMGHSISEVAMKFVFPSTTTISQVYHKYRASGKTSNLRHRCVREKILQERDQRRLTRIIKHDRRVSLPQIAADFNAGPSTSVTVRTIHDRYGLSEPKAQSCTLVDCMTQSFTPRLGTSTPTLGC
ncbi:HTH_Tnp_Tc3_2 domain-containing protein [Trichonephila clavipes]|uniref:HTH_Tnp_Tc3_2 domain-containing protein n=1 Tax=Trichonephila clavipes TaxID=2585209 RepID=A0A8X6R0P2_TRICX|nr:HTH_Tnp_Tc3_2 domain-containing protein [Trichonephila clavipes]